MSLEQFNKTYRLKSLLRLKGQRHPGGYLMLDIVTNATTTTITKEIPSSAAETPTRQLDSLHFPAMANAAEDSAKMKPTTASQPRHLYVPMTALLASAP